MAGSPYHDIMCPKSDFDSLVSNMGAVIVFWGPPVKGNYRPTCCVEQLTLPPIRASNAVATTMYALGARLSILTGGSPKLFSIQAPPPVKFP